MQTATIPHLILIRLYKSSICVMIVKIFKVYRFKVNSKMHARLKSVVDVKFTSVSESIPIFAMQHLSNVNLPDFSLCWH